MKDNVIQFPTEEEREKRKEPLWGTSVLERDGIPEKQQQLNEAYQTILDELEPRDDQ